jgi:hypothetical protein
MTAFGTISAWGVSISARLLVRITTLDFTGIFKITICINAIAENSAIRQWTCPHTIRAAFRSSIIGAGGIAILPRLLKGITTLRTRT